MVVQDAAPTAIDVRANDIDPDGGPKFVTAVTQPANGSAAIAGGGVTYQPRAGYCNDLGGTPDTFVYALNGGSTASVAVTVQCVGDVPPVIDHGDRPGHADIARDAFHPRDPLVPALRRPRRLHPSRARAPTSSAPPVPTSWSAPACATRSAAAPARTACSASGATTS